MKHVSKMFLFFFHFVEYHLAFELDDVSDAGELGLDLPSFWKGQTRDQPGQ